MGGLEVGRDADEPSRSAQERVNHWISLSNRISDSASLPLGILLVTRPVFRYVLFPQNLPGSGSGSGPGPPSRREDRISVRNQRGQL